MHLKRLKKPRCCWRSNSVSTLANVSTLASRRTPSFNPALMLWWALGLCDKMLCKLTKKKKKRQLNKIVISGKYKMAVRTDYTSHVGFSAPQNKCSDLTKVCHSGHSFCLSVAKQLLPAHVLLCCINKRITQCAGINFY